MSSVPGKFRHSQPDQVEKWHVPSVNSPDSQVFRHQVESESNPDEAESVKIPTAAEIEQWREQARAEGYQQGMQQASAEITQQSEQLRQIIEFFDRPLQSLNEEVEEQLSLLAVVLAQQLVRREIRADPGELIGVIREAVQMLPANSRKIRIYLHPEDAELVRHALQLDEHDEDLNWKLVEEPMISRGGCEIKSDRSVINVTLENRLQALAASVLGGDRLEDRNDSGVD